MFSFLLRKILKKGLSIPLSWFIAYPIYNGDVVVRSVGLGAPVVVKAEKAVLDLKWGSVFEDEVVVEEAMFKKVSGEIQLNNPLQVIRALEGKGNGGKKKRKQRTEGEKAKAESPDGEGKGQLEPLRVYIKRYSVEQSSLRVLRESGKTKGVMLEDITGFGKNVRLPVGGNEVSFTFKCRAKVLGFNKKVETEAYSVVAAATWSGLEQKLQVKLRLEDFPLAAISELFQAEVLAVKFAGGEGGSSTEGVVNGVLSLVYARDKGGRWKWQMD